MCVLVVGSVSGDCIEDDLIESVRQRGIDQTRAYVVKYGIAADEAHRFGLPCGGTTPLAFEPLNRASGIADLCDAVEGDYRFARRVDNGHGCGASWSAQATDGVDFDGKRL